MEFAKKKYKILPPPRPRDKHELTDAVVPTQDLYTVKPGIILV